MITGKDLDNRDAAALKARKAPLEAATGSDLAARLAAARHLEPEAKDLHCRDCWTRGRDAALRAIEGWSPDAPTA
ncbi:MAG TPA: hypothetical protein VKN16_23175 [Methylomirabilota bacterium]|jgi:hypothetical protein|nr:hypothetical protein [Methylomirabilota bacterium]